MYAYSLWRPFGYAVVSLGKQLENRPRLPPSYLIGQRICLHSTQKVDSAAALALREMGFDVPDDLPTGIIGTAEIARSIEHASELLELPRPLLGTTWWWSMFWFTGPVAIVLQDVRRLVEPIPAPGRRHQPFKLPDQLAERVLKSETVPSPSFEQVLNRKPNLRKKVFKEIERLYQELSL